MPKSLRSHHHFDFLLADKRMCVVHVATDSKFVGRVNSDSAGLGGVGGVDFRKLERLHNFQMPPLPAQFADSGLLEHLHEWLCRAVENRHLYGINVDEDVVYPQRIYRSKQALRGGEQCSLLYHAIRITYSRDIVTLRLDRKIVEVRAPENDDCVRGGGDGPSEAL